MVSQCMLMQLYDIRGLCVLKPFLSVLNQQQAEATSGISDRSCVVSSTHRVDTGVCMLVVGSAAVCHQFL